MPHLLINLAVAVWPGLGGRLLKFYKFRTMVAANDLADRRRSDAGRQTFFGRLIRRTCLDELSQLFNILVGEMSFVGPRPLLPVDLPSAYCARLLVRPGLTGSAQVQGGREVTASDKAVLDVWYVPQCIAAIRCSDPLAYRAYGNLRRTGQRSSHSSGMVRAAAGWRLCCSQQQRRVST
jgi:Bacterial sugar transferase